VFSPVVGNIFAITVKVIFIAVPIVNPVGMFFAIRRHKTFAAGERSEPRQVSVVFRREKKVALDMAVISLVLFLSLSPGLLNKIVEA